MDLRVRLLGRALRRVSVARLDDEALARFKERRLGHNPAVDLLLGGVARGVELTDTTAAGQVGPVPVRVHRPLVPDAAPRLPRRARGRATGVDPAEPGAGQRVA